MIIENSVKLLTLIYKFMTVFSFTVFRFKIILKAHGRNCKK